MHPQVARPRQTPKRIAIQLVGGLLAALGLAVVVYMVVVGAIIIALLALIVFSVGYVAVRKIRNARTPSKRRTSPPPR